MEVSTVSEFKYTLPLREISREKANEVGTKAFHLGELIHAGFPVPDGFVVTVKAFEHFLSINNIVIGSQQEKVISTPIPGDICDEIYHILTSIGDIPLAIRSSGIAEDLPGASFAGLYETLLDVRGPNAVIEAIRKCWASVFSARVLNYHASQALTKVPQMAVIVQYLINADAAGVMFTANPVTGNRSEVVINAVKGLGERLVSGLVSADEWSVKDKAAVCLHSTENAITTKNAIQLANMARKIEQYYTVPQDIEWAISQNEIFILQTRPITALPELIEWKSSSSGVWLRHFRLGEWLGNPVTPLFSTWLLDRLDEQIYLNFERVTHVPSEKPYHVIVNGWYYATGNFVPSTPLKALKLAFLHFLPGIILRPRRLAIITTSKAHLGMKLYERDWREEILPQYQQIVEDTHKNVKSASPKELLTIIDKVANAAGENFYAFIAVGGSAWKPESRLASFYQKYLLPKIGGSHQDLLQGLRPEYLSSYNHSVLSLDWYYKTLGEIGVQKDPKIEFERKHNAEIERKKVEKTARDALQKTPKLLKKFNHILSITQEYSIVREEQISTLTLGCPVMRYAIQELGLHLQKQGLLTNEEDVFFLNHEELINLIHSSQINKNLLDKIVERRLQWQYQSRLTAPSIVGKMPLLLKKVFAGVEKSFGISSETQTNGIKGLPSSPGRVTGPVRIIKTAEDFNKLLPGEILVAPVTNPAWTPLFAYSLAIITDIGSLMAHASLVAREYGIPAVVGTGNATTCLHDGQIVTVDGNTGIVEFIS